MNRCGWVDPRSELYIQYHDEEWGVPVYDDKILFEFLTLEGAQAGLNWLTILKKREGYRRAFANFEVETVARFDEAKIASLKEDAAIIRNTLKIKSTITNAQNFIKIQEEFGSFSNYLWGFQNGKPVVNHFKSITEVPASTPISDMISKDLVKRGFKFVGTTIVYAYMQAIGMVNDHTVDCFRFKAIK